MLASHDGNVGERREVRGFDPHLEARRGHPAAAQERVAQKPHHRRGKVRMGRAAARHRINLPVAVFKPRAAHLERAEVVAVGVVETLRVKSTAQD